MDPERVMAVRAGSGPGTGYVVGPRLLVTGAHVVGAAGTAVRVFRPGFPERYDAVVVWRGTPGGRDDGALVLLEDARWVPPAGAPVCWGRTVTFRPGIPCRTWGLPDVAQRPALAAELAQVSGTLNPGDGVVADRYVMSVDGPLPRPVAAGSPWGGLSGAGLFCGNLLTGVVAADQPGWGHGKIAAVPAYVLHRDPRFRATLARYGGQGGLEPVEWQELAEPRLPADRGGMVSSPAGLLPARRAVVPFRGRAELLGELEGWSGGSGVAARLVYGPGGQGKTRLAHEFGLGLTARGWAVLWLAGNAGRARIGELAAAAAPLLIVVDYAEVRTAQLSALFDACARHTGPEPVRVLLLARTAGSWWADARRITPVAEELLEGAMAAALPALEDGPEGSAAAYQEAVTAFAAALPRVRGQQDRPWARLAAGLPAAKPRGSAPVSALTLHMTALADLLDAARPGGVPGPDASGPQGVEDRLLAHEYRYWDTAAAANHLSPGALTPQTLRDAMAAALMLGAQTVEDGDALLARVPGLADQPYDRRRGVRSWISGLYPAAQPGAPWDGVQPDRLAERFLGRHLTDNPELADALVPGASPAQAERLLTFYARAAAHPVFDGALDRPLTALATRHPALLAPAAVRAATRIERPAPLVRALEEICEDPAATAAQLQGLSDHLPVSSNTLARFAAQLALRLVGEYRTLTRREPDAFLPRLAAGLNTLSNRLGDLGRREEALAASEEAVAIRRELARADPEVYLPELAAGLNNLAVRLAEVGRREGALAASEEAVAIRRGLARTDPELYLPELAVSINTFSNRLGGLGRREEALAAIEQAVAIRRGLARTDPELHLPDLAVSLNNLALRLGEVGRPDEALAAIQEAVAIRRELARARPDGFLNNLALNVNTLAVRLAEVGRLEEALAAVQEAVAIRRELARARPDMFLPGLAICLNNLAVRLGEVGRADEALTAIQEAVAIRRELARALPEVFRPNLAKNLNNLAVRLGEVGRADEALAAIQEAVAIRRELARALPEVFRPNLATNLHNLAVRLDDVGRRQEALAAIREAVEIRRELADARPAVYLSHLEKSLRTLAALREDGPVPES